MKPRSKAVGLALLGFVPSFLAAFEAEGERLILRSVLEIKGLSEAMASEGRPCQVEGVVLGSAEPAGESLVLRDSEAGLYVLGAENALRQCVSGKRIRVTGKTNAGGYAPIVIADAVEILGEGTLPEPRRMATEDLFANGLDAEWVRVRGIVRAIRAFREEEIPKRVGPVAPTTEGSASGGVRRVGRTMVNLGIGDREIPVELVGMEPDKALVDSEVEVTGICFNRHNPKRQYLGPLMLVPQGVPLTLLHQPGPDPYDLSVSTVSSLFTFNPKGTTGHRVRVRGVVLHFEAGRGLWLRDGGQAVFVQATADTDVAPGSVVDVVGFPLLQGASPILGYAEFRLISRGPVPSPLPFEGGVKAARFDNDLVSVEGLVASVRREGAHAVMRVQAPSFSVDAITSDPETEARVEGFETGTVVRVTGIAAVSLRGAGTVSGIQVPDTYHVLLRNHGDLAVLQSAPLLSGGRLVRVLLAAVLGLVVLSGVGFTVSRRRIARSRALRSLEASEYKMRLAERTKIARDIHDTVAQSLSAVSLQLELSEARRETAPSEAGEHVRFALRTVRTALVEVRGFIKNLRAQTIADVDLEHAIRDVFESLFKGTDIEHELEVEGEPVRLPSSLETQCLRIVQESLSNSLRHSGADRVRVRVTYGMERLRVEIHDNGKGFDPLRTWSEDGHFGILGMRERTALLGGTLTIRSVAGGSGTSVVVELPNKIVESQKNEP